MFSMQNFKPESAVILASNNSALIEKYLRNTCLGQSVIPMQNNLYEDLSAVECTWYVPYYVTIFPMFLLKCVLSCFTKSDIIFFFYF